jgi:tRNA(fMet)-specific endonuclease VapC
VIYLRDTNVFSRYLRGIDARIKAKLEANLRFCRLSAVVLSELEYGVAKRPEIPAFRERVQKLKTLIADEANYTCADAACYGFVRAYLARLKPNAQHLGPYDLMLAAQALRLGAVLVTNNTAEFARVPGLATETQRAQRPIQINLGGNQERFFCFVFSVFLCGKKWLSGSFRFPASWFLN